jgi:hypothetical protein
VEEVRAHPMKEDVFAKHYAMVDRDSGQVIRRGIHLIYVELLRVVECRNLLLKKVNFSDRSKEFSAVAHWWYCVLEYANQFNIKDFERIKDNLVICRKKFIKHFKCYGERIEEII